MFNKILWHIKQLFPFVYVSRYGENGERHLTIWNMWFGRCFNVRDYILKED